MIDPTDTAATAAHIETFLRSSILLDTAAPLAGDTPLLEGRVDSAGLMELLTFIEQEFGLQLDPDDINEDHFGTVDRIAQLVSSKADVRDTLT